MIDTVARAKRKHPASSQARRAASSSLSLLAAQRLSRGRHKGLGRLLTLNHAVLSTVGASNEHPGRHGRRPPSLGSYGAKLTGAGGGGSVVAVAPEAKEKSIISGLRGEGLRAFKLRVPSEGVRSWLRTVVVKLGGSVITDKSKPFSYRSDVVSALAEEIASSDEKVVVVHGGGSFGHTVAKQHGISSRGHERSCRRRRPDPGRDVRAQPHGLQDDDGVQAQPYPFSPFDIAFEGRERPARELAEGSPEGGADAGDLRGRQPHPCRFQGTFRGRHSRASLRSPEARTGASSRSTWTASTRRTPGHNPRALAVEDQEDGGPEGRRRDRWDEAEAGGGFKIASLGTRSASFQATGGTSSRRP